MVRKEQINKAIITLINFKASGNHFKGRLLYKPLRLCVELTTYQTSCVCIVQFALCVCVCVCVGSYYKTDDFVSHLSGEIPGVPRVHRLQDHPH